MKVRLRRSFFLAGRMPRQSMRLFCSVLLLSACAAAEQADWIWSAGYVVTMDDERRVIDNGAVAVRGERIAAVGPNGG